MSASDDAASDDADSLDALLAEQVAYYSARAPEYLTTTFEDVDQGELAAAGERFVAVLERAGPKGEVLELACGPGTWTELLLKTADRVTAVDASAQMLKIAAARIRDERVRFMQEDVFSWTPGRQYDFVFFGFWLSHVPLERFDAFWKLVGDALRPGGRVMFVDDGFRTDDELVEGRNSPVIRRRLLDGTAFRAIKVPHDPAELQDRLKGRGWEIEIHRLPGPFFWGSGFKRQRPHPNGPPDRTGGVPAGELTSKAAHSGNAPAPPCDCLGARRSHGQLQAPESTL